MLGLELQLAQLCVAASELKPNKEMLNTYATVPSYYDVSANLPWNGPSP